MKCDRCKKREAVDVDEVLEVPLCVECDEVMKAFHKVAFSLTTNAIGQHDFTELLTVVYYSRLSFEEAYEMWVVDEVAKKEKNK